MELEGEGMTPELMVKDSDPISSLCAWFLFCKMGLCRAPDWRGR